jgi:hypothetical protein
VVGSYVTAYEFPLKLGVDRVATSVVPDSPGYSPATPPPQLLADDQSAEPLLFIQL